MQNWWVELERRFKWGVLVSVAWLVVGLGYAWGDHGWSAFWSMSPNLVGDFFAGLTAPLAFLWLLLGYMQQGEEIKETRVEIKRQADSIEQNTQHAGRDILLRYAELVFSDTQFKGLQLGVSIKSDHWAAGYKSKINDSSSAYFSGDRNAPLRRLALIIKDNPSAIRWSYTNNKVARLLLEGIIENFSGLFEYAGKTDAGDKAIITFYEQSLYGDIYAIFCFELNKTPSFSVRKKLASLDEVVI